MAVETTSLADAKNRLSELISVVHGTGERVTITKNGRPVAVLVAVEDLESLTATPGDPVRSGRDGGHRGGQVRKGGADHGSGDGRDHGQEVGPRRGVRYELRLSRGARRALAETLPESVAAAVWEFVNGPLRDGPHRVGQRLRFDVEGYYSARRGQYRVIYRIDEHEAVVDVIKTSPRGDVYA